MKSKILALIALISIIAPTVLITVPVTYAQTNVISIVSVTPSTYVHPGETVTVEVAVGISGVQYTVELRSCYNTSIVWAKVTRVAPSAGNYIVTLVLPKSGLPGIGAPACAQVAALSPVSSTVATYNLSIAPLITVNATKTPNILPTGQPIYVNITGYGFDDNATIYNVTFVGPITIHYPVNINVTKEGTFTVTLELLNVTGGEGLPEGLYEVGVDSNTRYLSELEPANLTIVPQIIISPTSGHGRCDSILCELEDMTITGYGFDANSNITEVKFYNTNFSLWYNYTILHGVQADEYGHFVIPGSAIISINKYNMTAGMYNFYIIEKPATQVFTTGKEAINYNTFNTLQIPPSQTEAVLGTPANVTAVYYVNGAWTYKTLATRSTYTKTEVLRIDFTENGISYELAANLVEENTTAGWILVQFALYNMSVSPPVTLFNVTINSSSYNSNIGAYYAELYFNITPRVVYSTTKNATYIYHAVFYDYPNMVYLVLEKLTFEVSYANLTMYYSNTATGKFLKWYFVYNASNPSASNFTYSNGELSASVSFIDANIAFNAIFTSVPAEKWAQLDLVATPLTIKLFYFDNVYYIVRPLLVLISPSIVMPGSTVTLAAYGYGPAPNTLTITLDKKLKIATVPLGKDGNATFTIILPKNVTYGAHYLWGRDSYGYEYSLAIIVGSKAYWIKLPLPKVMVNTATNIVTAGYNGKTLIVCPYPVQFIGNALTYTVRYTGKCDYLGDEIEVVVSGLSPGDKIVVYFGNVEVATAVANSSGIAVASFTVPTLPQGSYEIKVVTPYGTLYPQFFNGTMFLSVPAVIEPKIVLTDLNNESLLPVLVGPGIVKVIGTGFPVGAGFDAVLINGTDAITTFAANIRMWTTNDYGELVSTGGGAPAIYLPVLQPGAYEISLVYTVGSTTEVSAAGVVYVVNNVSIVATSNELAKAISTLEAGLNDLAKMMSSAEASVLSAIKSLEGSLSKYSATLNSIVNSLNSVSSKVESLASQVSDLKSYVANEIDNLKSEISAVSKTVSSLASIADEVKTLKSSIASLSETATKIEDIATKLSSSVSSITSTLSSISTKISDLSSAVSTIESSLSTISSTVSSNAKAIAGLSSSVSTLKSQVSTLSSTLSDVKSAISTIESSLSSVSKTVSSVASTLSALSASVSDIKSKLGEISSSLSTVSSNVASLNNKVSSLSSEVSNVKSSVASLQNNVKSLGNTLANVKSSLSSEISSAKKSLQSSLGTVQVLVIVALILALIAAVASIFGAIQISRKLAG